MRKFFLLCGFLALLLLTHAQQRLAFNTDSLAEVLKHSTKESEKIRALQQLSDHWLYIDSAKAMQYAQEALDKSIRSKNSRAIAIAYYYVAGVLMEHYNLVEARATFQKAIPLLSPDSSFTSQQYLARIWHNLGAIAQREDNEEGFLRLLIDKACPILERIGDSVLLASNYYDIGNIFVNTQQFDKGLVYFKKSAHILKHHKQYADAVESYLGIVKALLFQENFSPSKKKEMETNLLSAYELLKDHPDAYPWGSYYIMKGMYEQYVKKNYNAALQTYNKGLSFVDKRQDDYAANELLNRKYYLFFDQSRYGQAKKVLDSLYRHSKQFPLSKNRLINLRNLIKVEEALGDKERAHELLKSYVDLADSVNEKQTNVKLNLIEQKYEHEKKEKEIVALKAENELKSAALKYNKAILSAVIAALLGLFILLVLGYLLYRNKQKLAKQQEQLHDEQLKRIKQEQQSSFFNAMIKGQEQERKRLAGDLHDGLGGLLSNIKLLLSKNPYVGKDAQSQEQHQVILAKLDNAVNELRRIARNMMPETLLRFGLITALRDFCEDLEKTGVRISLQTYGLSAEMDKSQQIMIYRILQELINNAFRHAMATNILVQCIQNDEKVYITIEDDGRGFKLEELETKKGIGLANVRNRVSYLNGQLDIQSEENVGTTINIEFNVSTEPENLPTYY